jgi:hypothetical protein
LGPIQQNLSNLIGDDYKIQDLLDHPLNLFLLYHHWSKSLKIWKEFHLQFPTTKVKKMIELAPKDEDVFGISF